MDYVSVYVCCLHTCVAACAPVMTTSCAQHHASVLEKTEENRMGLICGMDYLVGISFVPDDEVFKITLDYWNFLVPDVYSSVCTINTNSMGRAQQDGHGFGFVDPPALADRKVLYSGVLSNLRRLMIARMARPEEVGGCVWICALCAVVCWFRRRHRDGLTICTTHETSVCVACVCVETRVLSLLYSMTSTHKKTQTPGYCCGGREWQFGTRDHEGYRYVGSVQDHARDAGVLEPFGPQ